LQCKANNACFLVEIIQQGGNHVDVFSPMMCCSNGKDSKCRRKVYRKFTLTRYLTMLG
jgi:hypothetical protein